MIGRIIEVQDNNRRLSVKDGFLIVKENLDLIGKVPLDDISALILSGPKITISNFLINRLTDYRSIILLTDNHYLPANIIWPLNSYHQIGSRLSLQINMSAVLKKQLWKYIVFEKLVNQKIVLEYIHNQDFGFQQIIDDLKSGDKTNREAVGSKKYWPKIFGYEFTRNSDSNCINIALNYAYTILRAMIARSVASSGLHPALGIHHTNKLNAFCLVDDLIEPYRPFVDYYIYTLNQKKNISTLDSELKKQIVSYLYSDVLHENEKKPIPNSIVKTVNSYIKSLEKKKPLITFPRLLNPYTE